MNGMVMIHIAGTNEIARVVHHLGKRVVGRLSILFPGAGLSKGGPGNK